MEREARWKEESFPSTMLLCSTHLQNNVRLPAKNLHILHKRDIHKAWNLENSSQRPQNGPRVPSKWLQCSQNEPEWPQSPLEATPGAPKTNPSALKWSPKASPDPLKSIKKRVQDHPGTPLRKRTSPRCENPIIYYVFEMPLCENPIIYYVLSTSKTLIFLKSNENIII